ncbi:serine/threonine protein kinase (plasmid) [Mycobacterium adipatum]|uniref:non-specific serine/threonine protein kinase n=1 Tax=Mycobacterium adipatum TaxID=1682113 RepID=A0A172UWN7_9MYCO|nr:serine/threonine-protein kinase [Mycobacterium adipatum]ANE83453.1 serine/threonine protein kinase [Mycobacterium adipatum]
MALETGDNVGGYTIESVLGSGGMGTVYRAANPSLPRSDALKILSAEFSRDDQFRARFQREADVAATLDHPNIVAVYARGETEQGQLWIAMQYVPGTDADRELRAGTMTAPRAAHIVTEVAKALDFAHRRGILHRDIKPANFLISPAEHASDEERVFLADFGIARALDDAGHLTTDGTVMASVAYAAPEALTGIDVDHRSDIYSLGCSLFRMLTNKAPFAGLPGGLAAMAAAHMTSPPPRVTDLVPGLPRALDDVIAKAMAKDPATRYQSARELAAAATAAIADATTAIPRSTITQEWSTSPPPAQHRPPVPGHSTPPRPPSTQSGPAPYPSGYFSGSHAQTQPRQTGAPPGPPPPSAARSFADLDVAPKKATPKRRLLIATGIVAVIAVVAIVAGVLITGGPGGGTGDPRMVEHARGTAEVIANPRAVAAVGPGDADAVLALGLQPVAVLSPGGPLPGYLRDELTGDPAVMQFVDTNAVAAAKPDVIVATGDLDDATYQKLEEIAPTVTRPKDDEQVWNWQTQLQWVGEIVGREGQATQLISTIAAQQTDLRNQNAKVVGKTVSVVNVTDSGVSETLAPSNAADFLTSLGLSYSNKLQRQSTDLTVTRPVTDMVKLYLIDTDIMVVVRTDTTAGGGGAAGLPRELSAYRGAMVIVDDPDVIAALAEPGGALATQFLDATFVPELASRVP